MLGAVLAMTSACSSGADPNDVDATATPFSASSESSAPTGDAHVITSPSPGAVASKDGRFGFVVPNGWNLSSQPKALVYLSSATVAHDVAPTIVVTRSNVTPAPALADTLRLATMQARQDGQRVSAAPDRTVGGEPAVSFTAINEEKNVQLKRTYVMVVHEKALYFVTLTGAAADASRDESAFNALLASWTWTKRGVSDSTPNGTTPAAVPTTTSKPPSPSPSSSSPSPSSKSTLPSAASKAPTHSASASAHHSKPASSAKASHSSH